MHSCLSRLAALALLAAPAFALDTWPFDPIQYFESTTGVANANIPDTGGTWPTSMPAPFLSQTFNVPLGVKKIHGVEFTNITHTWLGDVQIVLVDPNGVGHNIFHRPGFDNGSNVYGSDDDFSGKYAFMNQGVAFPADVPGGAAIVAPSDSVGQAYQFHFGNWPDGQNNIFNSTTLPPIAGVWELRVYDWFAADSGSIATPKLEGDILAHFKVDCGPMGSSVPAPNYGGAASVPGQWNLVDETMSTTPLVAAAANTPNCTLFGAGATWDSIGTPIAGAGAYDNALTSGGAGELMDDFFDLAPGTTAIRVSGLPIGRYELRVHAWAPDAPTTAFTWVSSDDQGKETSIIGGTDWMGSFTDSTTRSDVIDVTDGKLEFYASIATLYGTLNGMEVRQLTEGTLGFSATSCTAGTSVNGCVPNLIGIGSTSLGVDVAQLSCSLDGGRFGGFIYGLTTNNGSPYGTGTAKFCFNAPRVRIGGTQFSGGTPGQCNGTFTLDLDAWWNANPTGMGLPLYVGESLYFQAWLRDSGNGNKNLVMSNGLRATFQP